MKLINKIFLVLIFIFSILLANMQIISIAEYALIVFTTLILFQLEDIKDRLPNEAKQE